MSKTVVTVVNKGTRFWMRGTTWSFHLDRADRFDTTDLAFAAIDRARPFMQKSLAKRVELWDETVAQRE